MNRLAQIIVTFDEADERCDIHYGWTEGAGPDIPDAQSQRIINECRVAAGLLPVGVEDVTWLEPEEWDS